MAMIDLHFPSSSVQKMNDQDGFLFEANETWSYWSPEASWKFCAAIKNGRVFKFFIEKEVDQEVFWRHVKLQAFK